MIRSQTREGRSQVKLTIGCGCDQGVLMVERRGARAGIADEELPL